MAGSLEERVKKPSGRKFGRSKEGKREGRRIEAPASRERTIYKRKHDVREIIAYDAQRNASPNSIFFSLVTPTTRL